LEGLVAKLTAPEPAAAPEVQGEAQTPAVMVDTRPLPEPVPTPAATAAPAPKPESAPKPEAPPLATPTPAEAAIRKAPEVAEVAAPKPPEIAPVAAIVSQAESQNDGVVSGGTMETRELCSPVRSSLSRVLGAWDKGDRDMALVLSAQLLADLTVLSRDEKFKATFDKVVSKSFENGAAEAVKSCAPLCVWSLVAAMNEVMRAA
jgi:outer membrane biosynthesis protein TonB